jgi:hypothetical protein
VLEYVSRSNKRKDYEDNFRIYEQHLQIPNYLIFDADKQALSLYRLVNQDYEPVPPNEYGRYAIPELAIEVALLDGWVRFWYQGKLLPLPADLQNDLESARRQLELVQRQMHQERVRAEQEKLRAEQERLHAEQEKLRADAATEARAELSQQLAAELEARLALEREVQQLRARLPNGTPPGEQKNSL